MIEHQPLTRGLVHAAVRALLALALTLGACSPSSGPSEPDPPARRIKHVVLLTIDTLRADALPFFGGQRLRTPNLSALARQSILFERAVATSPWTRPSMMSILTGLPPSIHGVTVRDIEVEAILPDTVQTLAERMQDAGYRTAGLGYNPFLAFSPNVKRGFQDFTFYPTERAKVVAAQAASRDPATPVDSREDRPPLSGTEKVDGFNSTPALTELTRKWLADHATEDFFLWVHYFDPHGPFTPLQNDYEALADERGMSPEAYREWETRANRLVQNYLQCERLMLDGKDTAEDREKYRTLKALLEEHFEAIRNLYLAEIEYVDRAVGQVLEALKWAHLYDDALIVVTADHGEEFGEHGRVEHGHTQYQELLHVPLFVKLPGSTEMRRVRDRVSILSVYPTILDLCLGEKPAVDAPAPSLARAWDPTARVPRPAYLVSDAVMYGEPQVAVFFDDLKYIWHRKSGKEELYDLAVDPGEKNSLVSRDEANLTRARAFLEEYTRKSAAQKKQLWSGGIQTTAQDPKTRKILRQHGYLK